MTKSLLFGIILFVLFFSVLSPQFALAETVMNYQVNIGAPKTISNHSIGDYIGTVYQIAMGVVGVLAVVVMMFGGIMWMMAGGSPERIQSAKGWIFGAMSGLVLAFSSYTILNIINPSLVKFKAINGIKRPGNVNDGSCQFLFPKSTYTTAYSANVQCSTKCNPHIRIGDVDTYALDPANWCCQCSSDFFKCNSGNIGRKCAQLEYSQSGDIIYNTESVGVCRSDLVCESCEDTPGDWCIQDWCCAGMCCEKSTNPDTCVAGINPIPGTKYCP